jgi:hypothetical protein
MEAVDAAEAEGIDKAPSIIKLATGATEFRRFDPGIVSVLISIRGDQREWPSQGLATHYFCWT